MPDNLTPLPTKPYKAIFAFVITFLGQLVVPLTGKTEFSDYTPLQWLSIGVVSLVTTAGVYGITNPPK